ncbi:carboxypeptidase N subunit 2 [Osmerus mordax]|uniref:carboxypeptidase N subunit 2 n=1 Tax=Osmerus mordax TaxID=8014 RepID=UPI00350F0595
MDRNIGITLCLMLKLCYQDHTMSETHCPARCHCFTPTRAICSEERMLTMPRNISQVRELVVMTTGLSYLDTNTFQENPRLAKLVFLNNLLREVSVRAFDPLPGLEELEISGNSWLERLYPGTFRKQVNLTRLLLNFNRFQTVTPGIFDSLQNLETLQLKGNLISHLPGLLFQNLTSLRSLDLSQNALTRVDRELLTGLTQLETLILGYNQITGLSPDSFHNVSQMRELYLDGNKISDLPHGIFSNLTKLEVLSLRGNLITNVSHRTFPFSLKELNLNNNKLSELSFNPFTSLTALTQLYLSSNRLHELPVDLLRNLTALQVVDLSDNQLTSLPEEIFMELSDIKVVHLHNNNLSSIKPRLFEHQVLLEQLYLSQNNLQNLPLGLLDYFLSENMIRLHGNPWNCDCNIQYMYDWMGENHRYVEDLSKMLCAGPVPLRGQSLASVHRDQLVCPMQRSPQPSHCTLHTDNDTLIIKCKVDKCSPLKLKVQLYEDDGRTAEYIFKNETSQCSNSTITV